MVQLIMGENGEKNGSKVNIPGWLMQIGGWSIAALLAYGAARSDIAVLQSRQGETERRLESIERKVDQLLARP